MRYLQAIGWIPLLFVMLILVSISSLLTGSYPLDLGHLWTALTDPEHEVYFVLWELRLPRLLIGLLAGSVLTLGGFFMQALIKNPLADPYIMGVTAGAGFGVNLILVGLIPLAGFSLWSIPLFAGLGALGSLLLVMTLGFRALFEDSARLLIAGVAVSAIFTAATGVLIYQFADSDQVRQLVFWTFGNLGKANWAAVGISGLMLLLGLGIGWPFRRHLDLLVLGSIPAQSRGLPVRQTKIMLLIVTALMVGGVVAFTGPIGFVGMMIPHFSRSLFGGSHARNLIPGCLLGAVYLVGCDVLTRWLLPPAGLPIGIITAILGVPFFLYLLFQRDSVL